MVWKSAGSTLYTAVERHNAATYEPAPSTEAKPKREAPEECCHAPEKHVQNGTFRLERIFQDRDLMLIAALILLLMHEKADNKLIIALAFVLLC